jgi:hypothetical protein
LAEHADLIVLSWSQDSSHGRAAVKSDGQQAFVSGGEDGVEPSWMASVDERGRVIRWRMGGDGFVCERDLRL